MLQLQLVPGLQLRLELVLVPRLELRLEPEMQLELRLRLAQRLLQVPPSSPGLGLELGSAPPLALARRLRPALAPARPQSLRKQPERCWEAPL